MGPVLTRRNAIATAAIASTVSIGDSVAAERGPMALPDKVKLYQRARGAPNGALGLHWYSGRYWGKRALQGAIQFFRVDGFSFNKMIIHPDGTLTQDMVEVGFWLDPITGRPADEWTNPYNGLPCRPQHYKSAQSTRFSVSGDASRTAELPAGMTFRGKITDPIAQGDTVWIGEDLIVEAVRIGSPTRSTEGIDPSTMMPPITTATSLTTYTMRRPDLAMPDSKWLPSTMNYQTMGNWYPWMRMGYETGQCMFQLVGSKVRSIDEIPRTLRQLIDERHPGFLSNPGL